MDREEAIKAFEEIKRNAETHLGKKYAIGCENYYKNKIELAEIALDALRLNENQTRSSEGTSRMAVAKNETTTQPAHIDREAWEPCEDCRSCENCEYAFEKEIREPCESCLESLVRDKFVPFGFCSHCGRPLTQEAWAELEKRLRG